MKFAIHKYLISQGLALCVQKLWKQRLKEKAAASCRTPKDAAILPDLNCTIQIRFVKHNIRGLKLRAGHDLISIAPRSLSWSVEFGSLNARGTTQVSLRRRCPAEAERNGGLIKFALDGVDGASLVEAECLIA